jgi:hypothetical protein
MAIAGTWKAGAVTPSEYVGATRWGTGINPIHGVYDNAGRPTASKETLIGGDPQSDFVPESVIGPELWGYSDEDALTYPGEDYRYLTDEHPNWGQDSAGRGDRDSIDGTAQFSEQDWPSWGPHEVTEEDAVAGWPLSGPPGGANVRANSSGSDVEHSRAIAVPTPGWRGGWLNKAHGRIEEAEPSAQSQYEITTSMAQLHQTRVNDAAVARGTDDPRAPIETRLTGEKVKHYAADFSTGGGPGTPDMRQQSSDLPYRPWFFRTAAVPPPPDTMFGTMTQFDPIERTLPVDAGEYVVIQEAGPDDDANYGYTSEDISYG